MEKPNMSFSFPIPSKSHSDRQKPSATSSAANAAAAKEYITEFSATDAPSSPESNFKVIAPIPNTWRPNLKLKSLPNLPHINGDGSSLQFELDPGSNTEPSDGSISYGLNLRQPANGGVSNGGDSVSDSEWKKLREDLEKTKLKEDLEKLPEHTGIDEFVDMPVRGYGAALMSGYGWRVGRGIGRNAKEDVKIAEVKMNNGRAGLGFIGGVPKSQNDGSGNGYGGDNVMNVDVRLDKTCDRKETERFSVGKEVRIVNGTEIGMKGKIIEVSSGGDLLVLRLSKSNAKVTVQTRDVVELGSVEEEQCMRRLKELKVSGEDKLVEESKDTNTTSNRSIEKESERVNWLRNNIRVRITSEELKGGRLFFKTGVVVDVVGPGLCDILMDESRELLQAVDQESLETAVPKRGGPVIVLYGRHKGAYGYLVELDSEKKNCIVRDADSHELLNVTVEQISEFTGDPSDIGY